MQLIPQQLLVRGQGMPAWGWATDPSGRLVQSAAWLP